MDISTMSSLINQSQLLNYSYRNMYVKNTLASNGMAEGLSGKTFKDMMALEKESPRRELVAVTTTTGEGTFLEGATDANTALKDAAAALTKSSAQKVTAENATGTASANATAQEYTLTVKQLAVSQVNGGKVMGTYGKDFSVGENTIELTVGGETKTVTFNVSESDTNKDSLSKMINAINKTGLDITASVGSTGSSATTSLVIKAKNTGTDNEFSIKDVTGNAAAATGAGNVTQAAANAIYAVDGAAMQSQSNNIKLQDGKVNLTLTKADSKDYTLKVQQDTSNLSDNIVKFVDQYNYMLASANENQNYSSIAKGINTRLRTYAAENYSALKEIGITYKSGVMEIDKDKLENAIKNNGDKVNNLFGSNGKLVVNANTEATSFSSLQKSQKSTTAYMYQYNYGSKSSSSSYSNFYDMLY